MASFPSRVPIGLLLSGVLILGSAAGTLGFWHHRLEPIQSFYLHPYVTSGIPRPSFARAAKPKSYQVLTVNGQSATLANPPLAGTGLGFRNVLLDPQRFHVWLKAQVYGGQDLSTMLKLPLIGWAVVALLSLIAGLTYDYRRKQSAREGETLRGPELITARTFNRKQKGDGIVFQLQ